MNDLWTAKLPYPVRKQKVGLFAVAAATALAWSGCARYFVVRVSPEVQRNDVDSIRDRLRGFLITQGFDQLGPHMAMMNPTRCEDAAYRFMKKAPDNVETGLVGNYSLRIVVNEFDCDGQWRLVIISSDEFKAERLADEFRVAFASEIAQGLVVVETKWRIRLD